MQTGLIIRSLRIKANLSQEQLAEKLFVSRELVSKWETNQRRPDRAMIRQLAEALDAPEEDFYDPEAQITAALADCVPRGTDAETLKDVLNGFLRTLNERNRAVFIRRIYYLESIQEIAEAYGMKNGTVRSALSRTRNKLKRYIKEVSK